MIEFSCAICGKTARTGPERLANGKKYCSKPCHDKALKRRAFCVCVNCGCSFEVKAYRVETAKYCSDQCRIAVFSQSPKGESNPAWQGGGGGAARQERRRARTRNLPATLTQQEWEELLETYNHSCAYCGTPESALRKKLHQEHVIPVVQGGGYTKDNIVPACSHCNHTKSGRTPEQAGIILKKALS